MQLQKRFYPIVGLLVGSVVVVVEQKEEDEAQEVKLLDFNLMIFFKGQKLTKFFCFDPFYYFMIC